MKATKGMVVSLQYTLTDPKGEVLESTVGEEPLEYLHGYGEIVPGLESALDGADIGFKKKITVKSADAYGDRDENAIFEAPRDELPADLEVGEEIFAEGPDGEPMEFTVVKLTETGAMLDPNHPLAGLDLTFDVEVMGMRNATAEELEHGHSHGLGCDEDEAEGEEQ